MIYFDRRTLRILRYINWKGDKGASWDKLRKKFGEDESNTYLLEALTMELYTVSKDHNGHWLNLDTWDHQANGEFRSYCSPKGRELLEKRSFDFWKWTIPTLISVAALVISAITLLRR